MFLVVDILLVLFVGFMLYRGIAKGFMNTSFTLVTAILWIALAAGCAFALIFFVFTPLGWMRELQLGMLNFSDGLNVIWNLVGLTSEEGALYIGYAVAGIPLFVVFYLFWLFMGRVFSRIGKWFRKKVLFFRIFGSFLGATVNLALAAAIVLGLFWVFAIVDGSGLFTYANDSVRAGYISGLIYNNNPLYGIMEHGAMSETVYNILHANFHLL